MHGINWWNLAMTDITLHLTFSQSLQNGVRFVTKTVNISITFWPLYILNRGLVYSISHISFILIYSDIRNVVIENRTMGIRRICFRWRWSLFLGRFKFSDSNVAGYALIQVFSIYFYLVCWWINIKNSLFQARMTIYSYSNELVSLLVSPNVLVSCGSVINISSEEVS